MYIGHLGAGSAVKAATARWRDRAHDSKDRAGPSLGTCMLAAMLPDLLLAPLMIAGIEHMRLAPGITALVPFDMYDYPWSHSLVMGLVGAVVLAAAQLTKGRSGGVALLLGAGVLSHWLLDFVTHRPDMPIGLHGPYVGLGLWNSKIGTAVVEGSIFALGLAAYVRVTRAAGAVGRWALAGFVGFLLVTYAAMFVAPPPSDVKVVAWTNLSAWLLVAWAWWIDRHRRWAG